MKIVAQLLKKFSLIAAAIYAIASIVAVGSVYYIFYADISIYKLDSSFPPLVVSLTVSIISALYGGYLDKNSRARTWENGFIQGLKVATLSALLALFLCPFITSTRSLPSMIVEVKLMEIVLSFVSGVALSFFSLVLTGWISIPIGGVAGVVLHVIRKYVLHTITQTPDELEARRM